MPAARTSKRSDFARAWEIARTSWALTTMTPAAWGSMIRAISIATWSPGSRLRAKSSSSARSVAIRPAERVSPASRIATSQKLWWMSSAIERICSSFGRFSVEQLSGKRQPRIRALIATGLVAGAAT